MYLLGVYLADGHLVRMALTNFYGIGFKTADMMCSRLQLHERARVGALTEAQITALSAYISSPGTIPKRDAEPTFPYPTITAPPPQDNTRRAFQELHEAGRKKDATPPSQRDAPEDDRLRSLVLETELRRQIRGNIAHQRAIGSYVGRRHQANLPVRGQRTSRNAITARKLNRIERRNYGSWAGAPSPSSSSLPSVSELVAPKLALRFGSAAR